MEFKSHNITFDSDVWTIAAHPSEPLFTAGLLSGHVYTYTWPKEVPSDDDSDADEDEDALPGGYKVAWKSRRHKGSCRAVAYSNDGEVVYATGTDSLIKAASSTTGKVLSKALVLSQDQELEQPNCLLPLNPHHFLVATDNGSVHLYDTRESASALGAKPTLSWEEIHDSISSITSLPPTSESTSNMPKNFITTGDTVVKYLDVRKGVVSESEDQENETLSAAIVQGVGKGGRSTRAYVGMGDGVVHAFERGVWTDMCERFKVAGKGVDVDVVRPYVHDGEDKDVGKGNCIAAGCGDGRIRIVKLGGNKVVRVFEHSDGDGKAGLGDDDISGLAFDCDGALMSAGGSLVKIWYPDVGEAAAAAEEEKDSDEEDEDNDDSDDDSSDEEEEGKKSKAKPAVTSAKRAPAESDDSDDSEAGGSKSSQRRKKRQKNKNTVGAKKSSFTGLD